MLLCSSLCLNNTSTPKWKWHWARINLVLHRIIEWLGLEGTPMIPNPFPPGHRVSHKPPDLTLDRDAQGPIQLVLNTSRDNNQRGELVSDAQEVRLRGPAAHSQHCEPGEMHTSKKTLSLLQNKKKVIVTIFH